MIEINEHKSGSSSEDNQDIEQLKKQYNNQYQ